MKTNDQPDIDKPIIVSQTNSAPIETVWQAITDVIQMRQWFFANIPDFKPQVGFQTQFTITNQDRVFPHQWQVTKVDPPNSITYNWKYEGHSGDSFVTFELTQQNNKTILKLTHQTTKPFPKNIPEFQRQSGITGWKYFIQKTLKDYLENK